MQHLTAVFVPAEEGGYTCWIEEIRGAISQGKTLEEAKENLLDALNLILECQREDAEKELIGIQNITRIGIPVGAFI